MLLSDRAATPHEHYGRFKTTSDQNANSIARRDAALLSLAGGQRKDLDEWSGTEEIQNRKADEQIIRRMRQHAGKQTSGFFINPCPEQAAPKDADEPQHTIAMRDRKYSGADSRRRHPIEPSSQRSKDQPAKDQLFE
jgi:hypothetical protein